jgi:hypothetical protein
MKSYPLDDIHPEHRNRQVATAIGLAPDEVELWVTAIEEDGSGMGYIVHFSESTPTEVLAKVQGLGEDRTINIGPID